MGTHSPLALAFRLLAKLFSENIAAQAKCRDLISIDFDPFLGTHEPAKRYVVGRIIPKGQAYLLDIYAFRPGGQSEKVDVTLELESKHGRWRFMNFRYPHGGDLMSMLSRPIPPCGTPRR